MTVPKPGWRHGRREGGWMIMATGAWGPVAHGGAGRRWPRRLAAALLSVLAALSTAYISAGTQALQAVQGNIDVIELTGLDATEEGRPLHVLVVGSDSRGNLSADEVDDLHLGSVGSFAGQRSDTVILASVSADRSNVSLVSLPRDLVVSDTDGGIAKLTETYGDGREALLRAVREDLGFPVNHYVEVSIGGFISAVDVVGSVRMCLEEPLHDDRSGADFEAGCQEFSPEESLAFVRSRFGTRGDVDRIVRQQQFIRAMLDRIISARSLLDPGRLVRVAEEVSAEITTDDGLPISRMVSLAQDLRGALAGDVEMVTVPAYPQELQDGSATKKFLVPYDPGLQALQEAVRDGAALAPRGGQDERSTVAVGVWTAGDVPRAAVVESTLLYGGFTPQVLGAGEITTDGPTSVTARSGHHEEAEWVAAHLGASIVDLPSGVELPEGIDVVVVAGNDASPR